MIIVAPIVVAIGLILLAIALGGPRRPTAHAGISAADDDVDEAELATLQHYTARDGSALAFRHYTASAASRGSVVVVHGSCGDSHSMHAMAQTLSAAGYDAYVLDVRGHGESGVRGYIRYIGQLEHDLEDFVHAIEPVAPLTLAGFSSGAGFALRVAGGVYQTLFDHYLLVSPFISQDAPTYRPSNDDWVRVGVVRYMAIAALSSIGIHVFDRLPVVRFAQADNNPHTTAAYSFSLAENYRPWRDWQANIRAVTRPVRVIAGQEDDLIRAQRLEALFAAAGASVPVALLPCIDHMGMLAEPEALRSSVAAVAELARSNG